MITGGQEALAMLPENIDGINQWPSILYGFPSPRSEILLNIDDTENVAGIRIGRFKLVKGSVYDGKYDKWYDNEGRNYSTAYSPRTKLNERLYRQVSISNSVQITKIIYFYKKSVFRLQL